MQNVITLFCTYIKNFSIKLHCLSLGRWQFSMQWNNSVKHCSKWQLNLTIEALQSRSRSRYHYVLTRRPWLTRIENICFYPTSINFILFRQMAYQLIWVANKHCVFENFIELNNINYKPLHNLMQNEQYKNVLWINKPRNAHRMISFLFCC